MQSVIKTKSKKTIAIKRKPPLATLKQETKKEYFKSGLKKRLFFWETSLV